MEEKVNDAIHIINEYDAFREKIKEIDPKIMKLRHPDKWIEYYVLEKFELDPNNTHIRATFLEFYCGDVSGKYEIVFPLIYLFKENYLELEEMKIQCFGK